MRHRILLACAVATWVSACATDRHGPDASLGFQPPAAIVVSAPAEVGLSQDRLARVDSLLDSLAERREVAGGVALIARHGRVAYFRSFGVMDLESGRPVPPDAIFRVASMTKPIVSVAAMVLYEEGAVQLDDPVSRYLPEVAAMQAPSGPAARQMTIQDLLRHTSGIPYGRDLSAIHKRYVAARLDSAASLQEMVAQMAALPLLFPPGSRWEYGYSTDVLGRVIEVVSQQPLDVFLRERVLEPLGMMDTDFFVPAVKHDRFMTLYAASAGVGLRATDNPSDGAWSRKPGLLSGGAGLVSTAPDYWRFSQMLLNGGALAGVRILSPTTVRLMTVNQVPPAALPISLPKPESAWMVSGTGFGLGFRVVMDPAEARIPASVGSYGWFGSHDTFFLVDPTEDLVGIFLAQFTGPPAYPGVRTFQNLLFQAIEH